MTDPKKKTEAKEALLLDARNLSPNEILVQSSNPIGAIKLGQVRQDHKGTLMVIVTLEGIATRTKSVKINIVTEDGSKMQINQTRPAKVEPSPQQTLVVQEYKGPRFDRPGFWWAKPPGAKDPMDKNIVFVYSARYDGTDLVREFGEEKMSRIEGWEPIIRVKGTEEAGWPH